MLKKTITYTDYNGVERTENFYFHLNKAEITEMEMSTAGGFAERLQRIVDAKDAPSIIKEFKELIMKSYGVKTDDGRGFRKSEELSREFMQTEAYSIFFMELATNTEAATAFIKGIVPADMKDVKSKPAIAPAK